MKDGTDQHDGQRDTSRPRVWMASVWACPEGEGKRVGRWREGVARWLSRGESDPARSGFCWFCSMRSFSSSRRMPSWNISASSSLEGETPAPGTGDGRCIGHVWEAALQSVPQGMPMEGLVHGESGGLNPSPPLPPAGYGTWSKSLPTLASVSPFSNEGLQFLSRRSHPTVARPEDTNLSLEYSPVGICA